MLKQNTDGSHNAIAVLVKFSHLVKTIVLIKFNHLVKTTVIITFSHEFSQDCQQLVTVINSYINTSKQ